MYCKKAYGMKYFILSSVCNIVEVKYIKFVAKIIILESVYILLLHMYPYRHFKTCFEIVNFDFYLRLIRLKVRNLKKKYFT
jgi:hypothetical protein